MTDGKRAWRKPEVKTIKAGSAENGNNPGGDNNGKNPQS